MTSDSSNESALIQKISYLEQQLEAARADLKRISNCSTKSDTAALPSQIYRDASPANLHHLLLIADTALPLGSFAFSSGLESFLAHQPKTQHNASAFLRFLDLSLHSLASTTLPYVKGAFHTPQNLEDFDNDLDASLSCTVARRASIAQGRALIGIWERSFRPHFTDLTPAREALEAFIGVSKASSVAENSFDGLPRSYGHLPPLFGTVCAALLIPEQHALYIYLLNHAKTLLSAAVRASLFGPYQSQGLLVSSRLRDKISSLVEKELMNPRTTAEAGQSIPMLDLWGGRHEIVYSRIFNS